MGTPPLLSVSRIALSALADTSVEPDHSGTEGGAGAVVGSGTGSVFPVVAVWADLSEVLAGLPSTAGPAHSHLPLRTLHMVDAALWLTGPPTGAREALSEGTYAPTVEVLVADAIRGYLSDGSTYLDVDERRSWRLPLPSSVAGLLATRPGNTATLPLLLMHGPAPSDPEFRALQPDPATAFRVEPLPHATDATLARVATLTVPPSNPDSRSTALVTARAEADPIRDLVWAAASGLALNRQGAASMAWTLALYLQSCAASSVPSQAAKAERFLRLGDGFDLCHLAAVVREPASGVFAWPEGLVDQVKRLEPGSDLDSLFMLVGQASDAGSTGAEGSLPGVRVSDVLLANPDVGLARLAHFTIVLLAAAALRTNEGLCALRGPRWSTPSFLLGVWLDYDTPPWWALGAVGHSLLHHDPELLADLVHAHPALDHPGDPQGLHSPGDGEPARGAEDALSPMLDRVLHALVPALDDLGIDSANAHAVLTSNDVTPRSIEDLVVLAASLSTGPPGDLQDEVCPACTAVEQFQDQSWEPLQVARAAGSLLSLLADISVNDLPVGEPEWLQYRAAWLQRWLREAVRPGQGGVDHLGGAPSGSGSTHEGEPWPGPGHWEGPPAP